MLNHLHRAVIALLTAFTTLPAAAEPLGTAPTHTKRTLTTVPNSAAITRQIWVPGLDDGYVPQGLTFHDGALYISSYKSLDKKQDRGPCRLYRVNPDTGATTGTLDLPATCGHAGGIARGPQGTIYVADTREIFEVAIATPMTATIGKVTRTIKLTGKVKGSFASGTPGAIWLGTYDRAAGAKIYRFPLSKLQAQISEKQATASVALPAASQGGAFDAKGQLWIMSSNSKFGELVQLDATTGAVHKRYAMPTASEDISFEPSGALWSLSEAGSRRWNAWPTYFPVIYRIDIGKLK